MQDIEIGLNAANDIFETCCFGFNIQNKEAETERKRDGNSVIFFCVRKIAFIAIEYRHRTTVR